MGIVPSLPLAAIDGLLIETRRRFVQVNLVTRWWYVFGISCEGWCVNLTPSQCRNKAPHDKLQTPAIPLMSLCGSWLVSFGIMMSPSNEDSRGPPHIRGAVWCARPIVFTPTARVIERNKIKRTLQKTLAKNTRTRFLLALFTDREFGLPTQCNFSLRRIYYPTQVYIYCSASLPVSGYQQDFMYEISYVLYI